MLLIALGTRPELLKVEPLLKYWKSIGFEKYRIWLTGQHKELCEELKKNWEFRYKVATTFRPLKSPLENRLSQIVVDVLEDSEAKDSFLNKKDWLDWKFVNAVLVQGDTASAFACALAAFHRKIPIIHLEAGLRSFDNENPYPEEFYRRSISMMASINLCPTGQNWDNLSKENVPGKSFITGNTILDTLREKYLESKIENTIICTLHRRENLDKIKEWFEVLDFLAEKYQGFSFILPIHKNPEIYKYKNLFKYVKCVEAMNHNKFLVELSKCALVITDSGGICEELSYLGKKMFIARKETERPEAKEFYTLCGTPEILKKEVELYLQNTPKMIFKSCPFGDGYSSKYITNILLEEKIIYVQ